MLSQLFLIQLSRALNHNEISNADRRKEQRKDYKPRKRTLLRLLSNPLYIMYLMSACLIFYLQPSWAMKTSLLKVENKNEERQYRDKSDMKHFQRINLFERQSKTKNVTLKEHCESQLYNPNMSAGYKIAVRKTACLSADYRIRGDRAAPDRDFSFAM